jgi:hypothetical protein
VPARDYTALSDCFSQLAEEIRAPRVNLTGVRNRAAANIRRVNEASDGREYLSLVDDWVKSEISAIERTWPDDAHGFRIELGQILASVAWGLRDHRPAEEFRDLNGTCPPLPSGGWTPLPARPARPERRKAS